MIGRVHNVRMEYCSTVGEGFATHASPQNKAKQQQQQQQHSLVVQTLQTLI